MNNFEQIIDAIKKSKKIVLLYHVNADGDAIGSSMAVKLGLEALNKDVNVFSEEEVPNNLRFLPQCNKIIYNNYPNEQFDLAIAIDCGDLLRLGSRESIFSASKCSINIDHHKNNSVNADINYIDENSAACGEIIYDLLTRAKIDITKDIAVCLYTAIITDCGSFRFENTSSKTHEIASKLIEKGVKPAEISRFVFDSAYFSELKLLGKILSKMELFQNNKISMLYLYEKDLTDVELSIEDISNIANYGLKIKEVELSIFLREESENSTKVSFRSKNSFNCSKFAELFNGGGHLRASGCRIDLSIDDTKSVILEKIKEIGI